MASSINADNGVVSGSSGLKSTADTSGVLALQSNGSTGITLGTDLVTTLAQPLPVASGGTGATSLSGITTGTATNLAGGSNGTIPYQSASGTTQMLAAGTSGQVLTSNGAAAPTWTTPASAGSQSFIASGAIASAGLPVALNIDGTVSTVAATAGSAAITLASSTSSTPGRGRVMMFSSTSNVYMAVYRNTSTGGIDAIAATLSGTTFTWGTAVEVASGCDFCAGAWDAANNKFVVIVITTASNMDGYVLSTSGTTISVGAVTNIDTSGSVTETPSLAYDPTSGKMILLHGISNLAYARVGTVSGTTSSWSSVSAALFGSNSSKNYQAYAVNGLIVFNGVRTTSANYLYLQVGTISGGTLTLYTYLTYSTTSVEFGTVVFSTINNIYYWCGRDQNASAVLSILQFTITSARTIVIIGSIIPTTVPIAVGTNFSSAYDPLANRAVVGYSASGTGYGSVVSILNPYAVGSPVTVENLVNSNSAFVQGTLVYSSTAGKVVGATLGTSTRVYGAVITTETSSNVNTIGLSTAAASNGASTICTIIGGINTGVSGLSTGLTYYASETGALTTTPTNNFKLGRALSATSLLITNGTFA